MSPQQEEHLEHLIDESADRLEFKYKKGQQKHGGDLFELDAEDLLEEALDENIDQFTYLQTALDQIRAQKEEIEDLREEIEELRAGSGQ